MLEILTQVIKFAYSIILKEKNALLPLKLRLIRPT